MRARLQVAALWSLSALLAGASALFAQTAPTPLAAAVALPRASVDLPKGWERQPPSSAMRAAQARIPGEAGPGELTVFYFGEGQGGGVDANLQRWISQIEAPPGSTGARDTFKVKDFTVTWIDVAGTLKAGTMGMGPSTPQPNSRLLAAVVEGPGGPWFFRVTGPDKTVRPQRDAFVSMLKSVRGN